MKKFICIFCIIFFALSNTISFASNELDNLYENIDVINNHSIKIILVTLTRMLDYMLRRKYYRRNVRLITIKK